MSKARRKMPVSERAKQFMPFAALKGFSEALLEKEKVIVPEKELSEDMYEELDRNYHRLEIGKRAEVVYYKEYEYVKKSGIVSRIDENARILQIVNTKIPLDDIIEISV